MSYFRFRASSSWAALTGLAVTRIVRHLKPLGATGLLLSSAIYCARPASAADLNAADILGFRLGQTPDEVQRVAASNLKDADVTPIRKRIMYGSFALDNVLLGASIKEGKDTPWYNAPNKEFLQINYSLNATPRVMYVMRVRYFDNDTAPAIQSLAPSIAQKYGPPAATERAGVSTVMYWSADAALAASGRTPNQSPLHGCGTELNFDINPFAAFRNGDLNLAPHYIDVTAPKCGTVIGVRIDPLYANPQLVHTLTASIGDFKELQASHQYIFDMLKKGAAEQSKATVNRASSNKPPL